MIRRTFLPLVPELPPRRGTLRRLGRRPTVLAAVLLVLVVGIAVGGWTLSGENQCAGVGVGGESIPHRPASACIYPDGLEVEGDPDAVAAAVAPYGGQIVISYLPEMHGVSFPLDGDLHELDRIFAELTESGFTVRYRVATQLPGER